MPMLKPKRCWATAKNFSVMNSTNERKKELLALLKSLMGEQIKDNTLLIDLSLDSENYDFAVVFSNWADVSIYACQSALQNSQSVGDFLDKLAAF